MIRSRRNWIATAILGLFFAGALVGSLWMVRRVGRADFVRSDMTPTLRLGSTSFADNSMFPKRLTCDGGNLSPDIELPPAPARTESWAIVMDDRNAPFGFIHWVIYNLPPTVSELVEGASNKHGFPPQAREGWNDFGNLTYDGPCPPSGQHRYRLRAYALDIAPTLPKDATVEVIAHAANGHIVAFGEVAAFYRR